MQCHIPRKSSRWPLLAVAICVVTPSCDDVTYVPSTGEDDSGTDTASDGVGSDVAETGIWQPSPGTTWQYQLSGELDSTVDAQVYDIDLFETSADQIASLQSEGRRVICYFSAGTWEPGRPDGDDFPDEVLGEHLEHWPDERWVDNRSMTVRDLMEGRMDEAVRRGCDGVEPDNVDAYVHNTGFSLTEQTQVDFNRFLAESAHERGLSVGLKNALDILPELHGSFDFAINEECVTYDECAAIRPFIQNGKAVFHVEYVDNRDDGESRADTVCPLASAAAFSTLIKDWDLSPWRVSCADR